LKILAISTSTEYCSAALQLGSELRERDLPPERAAGERILELVDALLLEAGIELTGLDAIAFGRGPGAFTGVRLAASVTQGLAAAADLPVIPVSDLQAVAQQAFGTALAPRRMLVCQDAQMSEVYWAWFGLEAGFAVPLSEERVNSPVKVLELCSETDLRHSGGAGSGFAAYPDLLALFKTRRELVWPQAHPHAREIARLAAHRGLQGAVGAAEAQPVYVRNQVATVPVASA
jgi:tRNA threonylcarbamoyladenosine biosynthesis protein TsaB